MPHICGLTMDWTKAHVTAASMALPPAMSTFAAASLFIYLYFLVVEMLTLLYATPEVEKRLSDALLDYLMDVDGPDRSAIVAVAIDDVGTPGVGIARYVQGSARSAADGLGVGEQAREAGLERRAGPGPSPPP